jgi:ribose transport system permease protein
MESSVSQQPAAEPAAQTPERKRPPRDNRRIAAVAFQKYALILAWLLVVIVFSLLKPDTYATSGNFQTIFGSQAVLLILALGLIVPLTSGDFDLSIAAVLSLASMVLAILQVRHA